MKYEYLLLYIGSRVHAILTGLVRKTPAYRTLRQKCEKIIREQHATKQRNRQLTACVDALRLRSVELNQRVSWLEHHQVGATRYFRLGDMVIETGVAQIVTDLQTGATVTQVWSPFEDDVDNNIVINEPQFIDYVQKKLESGGIIVEDARLSIM